MAFSAWPSTGLARFKGGKMRSITKADGLHDGSIYAIVPDKLGNYWMDSSRGIFRVSQCELNGVADGASCDLEARSRDDPCPAIVPG